MLDLMRTDTAGASGGVRPLRDCCGSSAAVLGYTGLCTLARTLLAPRGTMVAAILF